MLPQFQGTVRRQGTLPTQWSPMTQLGVRYLPRSSCILCFLPQPSLVHSGHFEEPITNKACLSLCCSFHVSLSLTLCLLKFYSSFKAQLHFNLLGKYLPKGPAGGKQSSLSPPSQPFIEISLKVLSTFYLGLELLTFMAATFTRLQSC